MAAFLDDYCLDVVTAVDSGKGGMTGAVALLFTFVELSFFVSFLFDAAASFFSFTGLSFSLEICFYSFSLSFSFSAGFPSVFSFSFGSLGGRPLPLGFSTGGPLAFTMLIPIGT